ncbi:GyrI-like domain-containing protein [Sabulibacter ruber]|uniref:GyrI-like domain-containing protein n=1 Tax=Sabulibacter ruber TaxID=2811901 RepID=UPI001A958BB6|nr:GyrI-like domain-containing protein [Sabulibacter ruber]
MDLQPRIETLPQTRLVGKRTTMSFMANQTQALWQSFMPRLKEIKNSVGSELYSVEVYPSPEFFRNFNPAGEFEKWAAVQVTNFDSVPAEMETLVIPEGLYAVFTYKGKASDGVSTYQYIYGTWIPDSAYNLDNRPHFALMGEKYRNEDPASEEELWIPITHK